MNCEGFLDRLYDIDARAAGRGLRSVPADMAAHLLTCAGCQAAYQAACADDRLLTRALIEVPPEAWRSSVARRVAHPVRPSWSRRIARVNELVVWGILAVAASQIFPGERSTAAYIAAFWAGGAAALVYPGLARHWRMLRRPALSYQ